MKFLTFTLLIISSMSLSAAQKPQTGQSVFSISGYVIDTDGSLVSGAKIYAMLLDRGAVVPMTISQAGQFSIHLDGPGKYRVYAFKDEKGYRQVSESLFVLDPESVPEAIVKEKAPRREIVIRLRPREARLIVRLIDSVTGRPLNNARVTLSRKDRLSQYSRSLTSFDENGEIRLLLPSLPLRIQASSGGYEDSYYQDTSGGLLLAPNETREITISLRPLKRTR
jgi:hypothetical protein